MTLRADANSWDRRALSWLRGGEVAVVHQFQKPPYGGGNQFLLALVHELRRMGVEVSKNRVGKPTRAVLINSFNFDFEKVRDLRSRNVRVVHRVDGPISVYRGAQDQSVDEKISAINQEVAHATIFQSQYSLDRQQAMGLKFHDPVVIPNSVDPRFFHRPERQSPVGKIKVVGTAWSDNPKKGAATFEWLDRNIDRSRFELTFVGRTKASFQNARLIPPMGTKDLGEFLRTQDLYLAASEDDPCSNALVEALACGLPAVFRRSGGHPELVGNGGVGFDRPEDLPRALDEAAKNWVSLRNKISYLSMNEVASRYLKVLLP